MFAVFICDLLYSFKIFQITVFDMNKHEDLDLAILSALLKGMIIVSFHFTTVKVNTVTIKIT